MSELIKGNWYKLSSGKMNLYASPTHSWYIKFDRMANSIVTSTEYIYTNDQPEHHVYEGSCFGEFTQYTYTPADMSEVRKYLPVGHPDLKEDIYRIKTKDEFENEYGKDWRRLPNVTWNYAGNMDYLFGKELTKEEYTYIINNSSRAYRDWFPSEATAGYNWILLKDTVTIDKKTNMSKQLEIPKVFGIYSENSNLLDAMISDLESLGYNVHKHKGNKHIVGNMSDTTFRTRVYNKRAYKELCQYSSELSRDGIQFTLPQDYNKALEFAKEAINSEYWVKPVESMSFSFGETHVEAFKGSGKVQISEGTLTKKDLLEIIDYFKKGPGMLGYRGVAKTIEYGCKSGSLSELETIYDYI